MATITRNMRITDLTPVEEPGAADEILLVDKDDFSSSAEGTDKKITIRNLLENAVLRPSSDPSDERKMTQWIDQWNTKIRFLESITQYATTSSSGVVELATDVQVLAKDSGTAVLTPSNLAAMDSTLDFAGLVALASGSEVAGGIIDNRAVTPKSLFDGLLGNGVFGNDQFVFRFPLKDSVTAEKKEMVVQYAQVESASVYNTSDPASSFNHIHSYFDVNVTFPQPFPYRVLMVIPMGMEVDGSYTEGTDFWIRPIKNTLTGATLRASRISGVNTSAEKIGMKYLVIGF